MIDLGYPNEIIDNKLYLGDAFQASRVQIFNNLKITHVINCTITVKNHFEKNCQCLNDYTKSIEYLRVPIDDKNSDLISDYFEKTFDFIENAFNSTKSNAITSISAPVSQENINIKNGNTATVDQDQDQYAKETKDVSLNDNIAIDDKKDGSKDEHVRDGDDEVKEKEYQAKGGRVFVHCQMGVSRSSTIVIAYMMNKYNLPFSDVFKLVQSKRQCVRPDSGFVKQLRDLE